MNCTVCNSNKTQIRFKKNEYKILRCLECHHLFTEFSPTLKEINEIYSDDYFFKGGAGYEDYTLERGMLIKRGEYYANKISRFLPPGEILDVGAAAGFILKGFENKGWKGMGIEPNSNLAEYGRDKIGVKIQKGTIETTDLTQKFDLVIMIQVIAHIYDLGMAIRRIHEYLKPNGFVLIETWNKDSLTAKALGRYWHEYSPPGTLNFFSKRTLDKFMVQNGFSKMAGGRPKKSIHSKHAKSLIMHKMAESNLLKRFKGITSLIPGNMILPYPSEDLFWALYRKN